MSEYHKTVLLNSSIEYLIKDINGTYADVTFGGGGHSKLILNKLGENGKLIAFDQDKDAFVNNIDDKRLIMVKSNFRFLDNYLDYHKIESLDGLIADLGVSSHQFDEKSRGFSYRYDYDLDMRMNVESDLKAWNVINEYDLHHLSNILYEYGEIKSSRKLALKIIEYRKNKTIDTTQELKGIIDDTFDFIQNKNKLYSQVFQAIRIEVNDELGALKELLNKSYNKLKVGGRLVIISYHSLEDRLVKNMIHKGNLEGELKSDFYGNKHLIFKKITPKGIKENDDEIKKNKRARSAIMRVGEKI